MFIPLICSATTIFLPILIGRKIKINQRKKEVETVLAVKTRKSAIIMSFMCIISVLKINVQTQITQFFCYNILVVELCFLVST